MATMPTYFPTPLAPIQDQIEYFFPPINHPYQVLERRVRAQIHPEASVLDIGCGRRAPMLRPFRGQAAHLYGIDLVDFALDDDGLILARESVCHMPSIASASIDIAYSRSVMEHIDDVVAAYTEIFRVLKPGGKYVFITPNMYDYSSIIARLVPNKYHARIVNRVEGRDEDDVFPTYYRSNSKTTIRKVASEVGFSVEELDYLGQYPCYMTFSRPLFWLGCLYEKMLASARPLHCLQGWLFVVIAKP